MSKSADEKSSRSRKFGPHGVGNPDDKSLRKTEINLLIPEIRRDIVKKEKCPKEIEEYQECVLHAGLFLAPFKCRNLKIEMHDCLEYWNDDDELTARARKLYLEERSEYRRTGVCTQNREYILKYLEEKKKKEMT